ncbi:hypothetical protein BOTCAL_0623g00040 [Botryotinia calthae]|uniref:Uncharacterized protein n=1 Tax=Botryotinia calthae TaxID=38488 RepID=A0A4Y8CL58_9HELO|nr:hypothetical protein BOTCAL_0623g00040 [Botryotinia calthae]
MTDQRRTPSPTHSNSSLARDLELMLEGQAEVTNEREERSQREERVETSQIGGRSEREEGRIEDSEMERDMRQRRMWMERQNSHQYIIGDEIEPVNTDNPSKERRLQAGGGRPRQGELGMWQEGRETRFQEMAHDQNPASGRREENRRLGSANFSSMESGQEVERGKRGRGLRKKTSIEKQETEEGRQQRLERNKKARGYYRKGVEKEKEIMNGNDPIQKEKLEQKRLKRRKRNKEYEQRKKSEREIGEKQQEAEIMEEDGMLVRTTVRSKQFRKGGTNSLLQQKTGERRNAQTLVEEEEDDDEDEDESEGEWRRYCDEEEDDE